MRYLFGDYTLDTSRCELHRTGRRIPLRPKVFDVLSYLIAHRDCVVSQQALLEHLWPQQFIGDATLKSCIKEARRAVGDIGKAQRIIQTLHGRGYRFVAAVEEASESTPEEAMRSLLVPLRMAAAGTVASPNATPAASVLEDWGHAVAYAPVLGRAAPAWGRGQRHIPRCAAR